MSDLQRVLDIKRRIDDQSYVNLEQAARILAISKRTLRRRIDEGKFEFKRGPNRGIFISVRSLRRCLVEEQYQPSGDFDATCEAHAEICSVKVEGPGTFDENVARIKQTYHEQGWTFIQVIVPMNDLPTMFFKRPRLGL